MRNILISLFILLMSNCYSQQIKTVKDSIILTNQTQKTLAQFEDAMKKLQADQALYVKSLFEGRGIDIDKVRDLKFKDGKFIFNIEK